MTTADKRTEDARADLSGKKERCARARNTTLSIPRANPKGKGVREKNGHFGTSNDETTKKRLRGVIGTRRRAIHKT